MNHTSRQSLQKVDENLRDSIKLQINSLEKAQMIETENYIIYSIGVESTDAHLNGALCLNDNYAEEMLQKTDTFFDALDLDYTIWVRAHADVKLEELLKEREVLPNRTPGSAVMLIEENIKKVELPAGFDVKEVKNKKHIADFGKVILHAFDKTQTVINRMFETEKTLLHDAIIAYVIYKDKKPVSAVMTVISECAAGIYWVGTLEEIRGQGLGSFATQIATNAGFNSGKNSVILQASELGEKVYTKLGYQTVTRYRTYTVKRDQSQKLCVN